ncbi:hypothetical protein BH09ACT1_BH09ACT1_10950 [soil metagenome]
MSTGGTSDHGRQGLGRALVETAKSEAAARGFTELSLRTYAEVPWNAPFYRTCGFIETEPMSPFHWQLVRTETDLGLDRYGRRILMTAPLVPVG